MVPWIVLLLAVVFGYAGASLTRDEKKIYSLRRYFPSALVILGICSLVFFFSNEVLFFTCLFSFVTLFTWLKA